MRKITPEAAEQANGGADSSAGATMSQTSSATTSSSKHFVRNNLTVTQLVASYLTDTDLEIFSQVSLNCYNNANTLDYASKRIQGLTTFQAALCTGDVDRAL